MHHAQRRRILAACLAALAASFGAACGGERDATGDASAAASGEKDAAAEAAAPRIVAASDSFDFGKVKQGKDVEHTYTIKNEGRGELIIERAKGS